MTGLFEFEEIVGSAWHRLVGERSSLPHHPESAVTLDAMKSRLGIVFRGLGGPPGIALAGRRAETSRHRLRFLQRLGSEAERIERAELSADQLTLPSRIDLFPDPEMNGDLYVWLAAYFSVSGEMPAPVRSEYPFLADLAELDHHRRVAEATLARWPSLAPRYRKLRAAVLDSRPSRRLPPAEHHVEEVIRAMLRGELPAADIPWKAPSSYRPYLPVPLWGDCVETRVGSPNDPGTFPGGGSDARDGTARKGERRPADQAERPDSVILNRFEKILSLAEMLNINRPVEDDDPDGARKALEDIETVSVSRHKGKPATRLRFDLDLPPEAMAAGRLTGNHLYPEWDFRRQAYLPDYCRILSRIAPEEGEIWQPDEATKRRIHAVKRQFEAFRPAQTRFREQLDGDDLDLDALVRARADLRAGGAGSDRIFQSSRRAARDLAVTLLVDVSLSTDGWIAGRRILDVEKEALTTLAHGIAAAGDAFSILTFTSRRRDWVRIDRVKTFEEDLDAAVLRRIAALKPGFYTRMGAAIRHAAVEAEAAPQRNKLIILLTDGKPNDVDHYENRFGVEDSRRAVSEARNRGVALFGVTVDRQAQDYFPTIFGRNGYAIIDHADRLAAALPRLYRQLTRMA